METVVESHFVPSSAKREDIVVNAALMSMSMYDEDPVSSGYAL